jgi:phosphate:Na+ symporter
VFHTLFNTIGVIVMTPFVGKLVRFLEKAMPAPKLSIVEPLYLNESIADFPETLLEAVRNEVFHLYENAFEIIAHGISIHRRVITSNTDLEDEIYGSKEVIHQDIDVQYANGIKSLHSAIIEFSGKAQTRLEPAFANQLFELRRASQRIVQAVKDTKHLQKNIDYFIGSKNDVIRHEYNTIRIRIARILRLIEQLRRGDGDIDMLDLDENKLAAKEDRDATIDNLDRLIRKRKITAEMATSLMNDLAYSKSIIRDLTRVGKILHGERNLELRDAENIVGLEDEEIRVLASATKL